MFKVIIIIIIIIIIVSHKQTHSKYNETVLGTLFVITILLLSQQKYCE